MSAFSVRAILARDFERYEGVRPIQIYLMRLGFLLVIVRSTDRLAGSPAEDLAY